MKKILLLFIIPFLFGCEPAKEKCLVIQKKEILEIVKFDPVRQVNQSIIEFKLYVDTATNSYLKCNYAYYIKYNVGDTLKIKYYE